VAEMGRVPLAGGESEGDHTVRPWGGWPGPFYSKAFRKCGQHAAEGQRSALKGITTYMGSL